jgi:hypothetical protein
MKTFTMRMLGVVAAISLLGLVMAYLAGFFESKITPEALVINNGKPVGNTITVKTGDILATLDSRELGARLDQQQEAVAAARARLNEIESNYNRIAPLVAKGVATQAEFDRAEAALRAAQAELAGAMRATDEANTALS